MTENIILYLVIGVIGALVVLSFVVGIEKMIKIVLGNYILSSICLAASQSIDFFVNFLQKMPELKFAGMTYKTFAGIITDWKIGILLFIYFGLLVVIYRTSRIRIVVPHDPVKNNLLKILFVPLTVFSMILTLQIVTIGISVADLTQLQLAVTEFTKNTGIYFFVTMAPVWIFLHGIVTILITSEMKIRIKTADQF